MLQEGQANPKADAPETQAEEDVPPVGEKDASVWSLASSALIFSKQETGGLQGTVEIATDAVDAGREFGAGFVASKTHDQPLDSKLLTVTRDANTLTVSAPSVSAKNIPNGTEVAIYFADEEEQAKKLPVEIAKNA